MDLGGTFAGLGAVLAIYVGATIAVGALGLWLGYTIIWRAVRRGMREFYGDQLNVARSVDSIRRSPGPRDW